MEYLDSQDQTELPQKSSRYENSNYNRNNKPYKKIFNYNTPYINSEQAIWNQLVSNKEEQNEIYEKPKWVQESNSNHNQNYRQENDFSKNKGRHSKRNSNLNPPEEVQKKMIEKDKVVLSTGVKFYNKDLFNF